MKSTTALSFTASLALVAAIGFGVSLWEPRVGLSVSAALLVVDIVIFFARARSEINDLEERVDRLDASLLKANTSLAGWTGFIPVFMRRLESSPGRNTTVLEYEDSCIIHPNGDTDHVFRSRARVDEGELHFVRFAAGGWDPGTDIPFTAVNVRTGGHWPTVVHWSDWPTGAAIGAKRAEIWALSPEPRLAGDVVDLELRFRWPRQNPEFGMGEVCKFVYEFGRYVGVLRYSIVLDAAFNRSSPLGWESVGMSNSPEQRQDPDGRWVVSGSETELEFDVPLELHLTP